jgi:aerobic C4-dicarboxylate transport protein
MNPERESLNPWRRRLYLWVLIGTFIGGLIGYFIPTVGTALKPLGDGFVSLLRMIISPIVFCTVVLGISGAGDMRKVGRVGLKSLIYFETVSTFALIIGLLVGNILKPGSGFHIDSSSLDPASSLEYVKRAGGGSLPEFILHLIPKSFFSAFGGEGDLLQVLLIAVLFGSYLESVGRARKTSSRRHRNFGSSFL